MALISDSSWINKLNKNNINIKTKYIVGNSILERNTDNSSNDDIKNGIRCEKDYYVNKILKHKENQFDSRIEYTFISNEELEKENVCPNCGMRSTLKEVVDGCPYCGTNYNIDYLEKDLGGKYHYDRVLRNTTYRIITALIDLIICIIISFVLIKSTSRTFNEYDITKAIVYGCIASLIFYYFFYIMDAYIILSPIKNYKDKKNQEQIDFWNRTKIDKKTFFNNFNYEVRNYLFNNTDVIDYDIIDYDDFSEYIKDDVLYVKVKIYIRKIYYSKGNIIANYDSQDFIMKKINDETLKLNNGTNIIKCHNCGASIDVTKGKCEYCDTTIKYLQNWILDK